MSIIQLLNFKSLGDSRGDLISLEGNKDIPFEIKRVYFLFDTKEFVRRGYHAHKELKQIALVIKGSCRFLLDNGKEKEDILLDNPLTGLYIDSFVWREMYDFSDDCVLMVFANAYYDESDYVRDYNEFTRMVNNDS